MSDSLREQQQHDEQQPAAVINQPGTVNVQQPARGQQDEDDDEA
jgi:hypothetical protein